MVEKQFNGQYANLEAVYTNPLDGIVDPIEVLSSNSISFDDTTWESFSDLEMTSSGGIYEELIPMSQQPPAGTVITISGSITKSGTTTSVEDVNSDGYISLGMVASTNANNILVYIDVDFDGTVPANGVIVGADGSFSKSITLSVLGDKVSITAFDIKHDPDDAAFRVLISDLSITVV